MTWTIDKQFDFCYGHRVWVQKLNKDFCAKGDTSCKCRFPHGHQGHVHVFLQSNDLNQQGMVSDFKHLGWLKDFLDNTIDHKFILDLNDPTFHTMTNANAVEQITPTNLVGVRFEHDHLDLNFVQVLVPGTKHIAGLRLDTSSMEDCPDKEYYDGFFFVNFVPTSERLSEWLYDIVNTKMSQIGVETSKIDWFETPKSRATYTREDAT